MSVPWNYLHISSKLGLQLKKENPVNVCSAITTPLTHYDGNAAWTH